jgi:3-polyprenyl-4-hydroxybenzoate decarboxylase
VPAFYSRPQTLDEVVNHSCARLLDLFDLDAHGGLRRWDGLGRAFEPFIDPTTTTETP